jgi:MoxR-like ATPase
MNPTATVAPLDSRPALERALRTINHVVVGKPAAARLALACLLARGHLLIEDVPGVGKTVLAHTLARVLGLPFARIQFTSDLLPADIIGVSIYDAATNSFRFHPGPIFASVVLADEINRATPKAQSALLEAMEERQVTAEGITHPLPQPFFVIATQNPRHQIGTFPLPESQLDRFLMRLHLGYPDAAAEAALLKGQDRREMLKSLPPVFDARQLLEWQRAAASVIVSDALIAYVQALLSASRRGGQDRAELTALSPRAGLALLAAARAHALLSGREMALPEDVQAVAPAVLAHRLAPDATGTHGEALAQGLIRSVPIP